MRAALALARRGLGRVSPNPAVGCVLVRPMDGVVIGRGWTQPGGRPHAETEALARAGDQATGATAYVTLEPCAHQGETGPCADALTAAGIGRCVVAITDPDPRVAGGGIAKLEAAGIKVDVGCCAAEAETLNVGFLTRVRHGRPWVALKMATTLDGMVAADDGNSKWITGPEARARGHLLRARADDPQMTCRLAGLEDRSPVRAVMIGHDDIPGNARIKPCEVFRDMTPAAVVAALGETGITRLLVEAGPRINAAFLAADLIDELHWFRAPTVMGGDGLAAFGAMGHDDPEALPGFGLSARMTVGVDTYEVWRRERMEG